MMSRKRPTAGAKKMPTIEPMMPPAEPISAKRARQQPLGQGSPGGKHEAGNHRVRHERDAETVSVADENSRPGHGQSVKSKGRDTQAQGMKTVGGHADGIAQAEGNAVAERNAVAVGAVTQADAL